jgi:hypothetical protein
MLAAVLVNLGLSAAAGGAAWRWMVGLPAIPGVKSGSEIHSRIKVSLQQQQQQRSQHLQGVCRQLPPPAQCCRKGSVQCGRQLGIVVWAARVTRLTYGLVSFLTALLLLLRRCSWTMSRRKVRP